MTRLEKLLRKYHEDDLFRRVCIGSATWAEMLAEAILEDRTGKGYVLASHNAAAIDLVAEDGQHVQVKTVGTHGSFAGIRRGRDNAALVMVITTFGDRSRFFLMPMDQFKRVARTYEYPKRNHFSWEISGSRIRDGLLEAFEVTSNDNVVPPPTKAQFELT